jgi:hypothetical protein
MTPEQAAEILLVQAVEEVQPEALPPGSTVDALEAAGDLEDEGAWFARRAAWLLDHPLSPWLALLRVRNAFAPSLLWCVAVPFVLGLSSNALGPRAQIHVIYNPIVLLVAWSLLSYVGLLALKLRRPPTLARPGLPRAELRLPSPEGGFLMRFARRSAARLWLRAVKGSADAREQTRAWMAVGSRFFELWERAARPWVALRTRRLMHLGIWRLSASRSVRSPGCTCGASSSTIRWSGAVPSCSPPRACHACSSGCWHPRAGFWGDRPSTRPPRRCCSGPKAPLPPRGFICSQRLR